MHQIVVAFAPLLPKGNRPLSGTGNPLLLWEVLLFPQDLQYESTALKDGPARKLRSEKLQNESSPNFSNFRPEFCPEFCSEFSPNFVRSFRASFRGKRRPEKIHQKSPPFFNAKFPGKYTEKKKDRECFWRAGKVTKAPTRAPTKVPTRERARRIPAGCPGALTFAAFSPSRTSHDIRSGVHRTCRFRTRIVRPP